MMNRPTIAILELHRMERLSFILCQRLGFVAGAPTVASSVVIVPPSTFTLASTFDLNLYA
jgi:hypothetical protein